MKNFYLIWNYHTPKKQFCLYPQPWLFQIQKFKESVRNRRLMPHKRHLKKIPNGLPLNVLRRNDNSLKNKGW